ncbi:hypothetical protein FGG08_007261 [Glutinoglossum americanum]|uniref:NACHT domain-containing protein n=1 Tax=Glutinoglossum americanum TaxID=1670608 RepID=A0A9P8HWQ1_9PEZI|nr:hypothetical protein FGG08_007261 [Glutinoglossum americanum]
MDPLTAVSFAAGILQFIDFSWGIISGTYEVYRSGSGTTAENAHISTVLTDLERVTDGLCTDIEGKTKHERELCKLADKCHDLSQDLAKILRKLKATDKNSKWQSLKVKWASMRNESEVASVENRLDRYRAQILLRLNFMLKYVFVDIFVRLFLVTGNNSEQQSSVKTQLDKMQKEGTEMSTETASQFTCLRKELGQAVQGFLKKLDDDGETNRNNGLEQTESLAEIRTSLSKLQGLVNLISKENRVLRRLYFESVHLREDNIAEAESGTFAWILETGDDEPVHSTQPMSYPRSLSSEDTARETESSVHTGEEVVHEETTNIGPLDSSKEDNEANNREDELSHEGKEQSHRKGERTDHEGKEPVYRGDEALARNNSSRDRMGIGDTSNDENQSEDGTSVEEISRPEQEIRKFTRDTFLAWLRSGRQIYHISGKAGSGKSTLMKFLSQHSRVREELESWAGGKKLVLARFFFWNSGDRLQMSLEGLYRAILFETLRQHPELIPDVFPDQWNDLGFEKTGLDSTAFRFQELKSAFKNLIGKQAFEKHRICLFIDGLDEYEGDSVDHWGLARDLQSWASSEDMKICVSSRPHTEFLGTFSDDSKLRIHLHELTRGDIRRFARAMFKKDPNFDRIKGTYLDLVRDIVGMADGVFLWARLVVRSLLGGVGHCDSPSALREKLNTAPKGLDDLFDKLFDAIEPGDRRRSDKLLLIVTLSHTAMGTLNALACSWLEDLDDPNFPFTSPVQGLSDEEIKKRHRDLPPQLDSLSKGLLEINSLEFHRDLYFAKWVQFFHRTVRDYLQDDSRQSKMKSRVPGFDVNKALCRLILAQCKFARVSQSTLSQTGPLRDLFYESMRWLGRMRTAGNEMPSNFVEEFGRILDGYRQSPYFHPAAEKRNDRKVPWGLALGTSSESLSEPLFVRYLFEDISHVHWAASIGATEYIRRKVSEDATPVNGNNTLSLLLSAAVGLDHELTYFLLQAGASPNELVETWQGRGPDDKTTETTKTASTWMIFLFILAHSVAIGGHRSLPFERCSLVLEQFLKFGADSDVFFLLYNRNSEPTDDQLLFISLQQLVSLMQPRNFESIQSLLQAGTKRPFWSKPTSVLSRLTPWMSSPVSVTSKYKAFEDKELRGGRYRFHSVFCKDSQLECNFYVRIF